MYRTYMTYNIRLPLTAMVCLSVNTTDACGNLVMHDSDNAESADDPDIWKPRMREIQGAIILASLFQVSGRCEVLLWGC